MNDTKEILDKLREINKTMSYEKIGRKINVSGQTVYRWLNGHNSPSGLALEKVAKFVAKK